MLCPALQLTTDLVAQALTHEKSAQVIGVNNAIAWNPSAAGIKVEDTLITTPTGFEIITSDPSWPSVEMAGRARPDIARP